MRKILINMWKMLMQLLSFKWMISWLRLDPLLEKGAEKTWGIIIIVVVGALLIEWSSHRYEALLKEQLYLQRKERVVRSVFIKWKSQNAQYKLQSNVAKEVKQWGIAPSKYPPKYIELKDK